MAVNVAGMITRKSKGVRKRIVNRMKLISLTECTLRIILFVDIRITYTQLNLTKMTTCHYLL